MNWRAFIIVFLMPAMVLAQVPSPDRESPPIQTIPAGEDKIVSLKKGEPAPFDGQLFSPDTALRWAHWLQQYKYRLVWDVELVTSVCTEEKSYRDKLLTIEKKRAETVEDDLSARLTRSEEARIKAEEEVRNPPWYSTTEFGVVIGAVAAVAVMAVAVWALEARSE